MYRHSYILHCADLTLPSSPPRSRLCRAIRHWMKKKKLAEWKEDKRRVVESREPAMGDALVTHDGLRGHIAEKMYIHSDTAKDMAADRRGERGLTDVSLCCVCYLHYFDIIIPVALYLTAPSLFCIRCTVARLHIVRCREFCFISFPLFFFNFILMTIPFACICSWRLQCRMPLIAMILYVP